MTRYTSPATFVDDVARAPSVWGAATGTRYRVLCSDGRVRIATATAEPDTMYTVPARLSAHGRTVTGSVYHRGTLDYARPGWPEFDDTTPLYRFSADTWRANASALPAWPESVRHE